MCHSVESYMPGLALRDAERRLGAGDFAAARRERAMVDAVLGLLHRLGRALHAGVRGGAISIRREDVR